MALKPRLSNQRIQQHIAHKDDKGSGGGGGRVLRGISLPDYKAVEGSHRINIIPFPVKNPAYVKAQKDEIKIGDWEVYLDVWVHSRIGGANKDFLCLKQFGKPCPLCTETSRLYDESDRTGEDATKKRAQDLKAKRRSFILVQPIVKGEPQELHLYNASHFAFTDKLLKEANDNPGGGGPVNFADPDDGKVVYFRASKSPKLAKALDFEGFKFPDRDAELGIDWEKIPSLDEHMVIPDPKEMEAALFGGPEEDEAPGPEASGSEPPTSRAPRDEEPPRRTVQEPPRDEKAPETPKDPAPEAKPVDASGAGCPDGGIWGADNGARSACGKCLKFDACLDASF